MLTTLPDRARVVLGFAALGLFWGAWGAALPAVQESAGVTARQLGLALLAIGAGALPAMRLAGRLLDRYGGRMLAGGAALFGVTAVLPALARDAWTLAAALFLVGAASGGFDVLLNGAGVAQEASGRPLMSLAHASFSATVVVVSLATGLARAAGGSALLVLGTVGGLIVLIGAVLPPRDPATLPAHGRAGTHLPGRPGRRHSTPRILLVLGALGSLAYLVENAQQNWSALHLERTLGAAPQVSALGPALFATATALARFTAAALPDRVGDRLMIQLGATVAAAGTALVAAAISVPTTLVGVVIAGIGTAVCAPTLISLAGRQVPAQRRGRAIATVTALAYLGFLAGPAYVGVVAGWAGLPAGLGAVAVVAAVLAVGAAAIPKPRP